MIVVFVVLAVVVIVGIALVAVGRVTASLAAEPPPPLFDLEEAVHYVADLLPDEVTARISYDDVRALLTALVDRLEEKGVALDAADLAEGAVPAALDADPDLPDTGVRVEDDDDALAFMLGRATDLDLDVEDTDVVEVLRLGLAYLREIGAIGTPVTDEAPAADRPAPHVRPGAGDP